MLFKDLLVGDLFKAANPKITKKFIKISNEYDDRTDITKWDLPYIRANIFILDSQSYGMVTPNAEVELIKRRKDSTTLEVI